MGTSIMKSQGFTELIISCAFFLLVVPWLPNTAVGQCSSHSTMVGFKADFTMVQHQLRGSFLIVDDCTFTVSSRFSGSRRYRRWYASNQCRGHGSFPDFEDIGADVTWWGALGVDIENLLSGQPISESRLAGSYRDAILEVSLKGDLTWEDVKVLSVWDSATASNFGHIVLQPLLLAPPLSSGGSTLNAPDYSALGPTSQVAPAPSYSNFLPPALQKVGELQPTMFDNCLTLAPSFRMRWTLGFVPGTVDIGLEYALTKTQYMAFGWAKPGNIERHMLDADVVVTGIDDKGVPLSEDYYISSYGECNWDNTNPAGVCPDSFFAGITSGLNNSELLHGQQIDGITLIRYRRPLVSEDHQYDVSINATNNMTVIWAMGSLSPDSLRIHHTPQNHGAPKGTKYGYLNLTLESRIDQCDGPLAASNASQGNIIVADRGTSLVVTSDIAYEYPNPPNPKKVFYINQKEAPLLKVERGVPVTFVVQAGHDVSFYVTSNPIGGVPRIADTVYAGGSDAHGVPTIPYTLNWLPDRKTPNEVYYQAYFQKKMGWKVLVVDGGLSDMYNTSHLLANNEVTLFWTLTSTDVFFAVRAERKSGYLAVAFGSGMLNSFAYVAWTDGQGIGHIGTYWIDDKDSMGIHPTAELLSNKKCERTDGIITFEFSRPLQPDCQSGQECKNVIDPTGALKMVWAIGDEWSDNLTNGNIHTMVSTTPTLIYLAAGAAKVELLQPVLAVHGFMMFLAWGIFFPGGVMAARYIKHINQHGWLSIHVYAQVSGTFVTFLGLLFAVAELHGLKFDNMHMKLGVMCILIACLQAINGFLRPHKVMISDRQGAIRVIWQYIHLFMGRSALLLGFVTLLTGFVQLGTRDAFEYTKLLEWVLIAWFLGLAVISGYIEMHDSWIRSQQQKSTLFEQSHAVEDKDVRSGLLVAKTPFWHISKGQSEIRGSEVQLESFYV